MFEANPRPVDIVVVLGAGERHGAAATAWSCGLLGRRFFDPGGTQVRNYTRPRTFALPGYGRRRVYRTAFFSDQHVHTATSECATYFGLDLRLATTALALLTWVPAPPLVRGVRPPLVGERFPPASLPRPSVEDRMGRAAV